MIIRDSLRPNISQIFPPNFQTECSTIRLENESLRQAGGRDIIRDRATYASQQLLTAANTAETTLK